VELGFQVDRAGLQVGMRAWLLVRQGWNPGRYGGLAFR
jgi:hypothetical protein